MITQANDNVLKRNAAAGLFEGPDGWLLAPEGGLIRRDDRIAVIADVHLGYEWARAARGDVIPEHSLADALAKLERMFDRAPIDRLIVAGDLVESTRRCDSTARDVDALRSRLSDRSIELVRLAGNHDAASPGLEECANVAGWKIIHGHIITSSVNCKFIQGHIHPVLKAAGITAPCFLVAADTIVLPAFSSNAAGVDVASAALPAGLKGRPLRCVASSGVDLRDFGPVCTLSERLRRLRRR